MYIRVKRHKTTYFIQCDPTESTLDIKQKLQGLIDQPSNSQRLTLVSTNEILDDSKTLAEQKVLNQSKMFGDYTCLISYHQLEHSYKPDYLVLLSLQVENDAIVALTLKKGLLLISLVTMCLDAIFFQVMLLIDCD